MADKNKTKNGNIIGKNLIVFSTDFYYKKINLIISPIPISIPNKYIIKSNNQKFKIFFSKKSNLNMYIRKNIIETNN